VVVEVPGQCQLRGLKKGESLRYPPGFDVCVDVNLPGNGLFEDILAGVGGRWRWGFGVDGTAI